MILVFLPEQRTNNPVANGSNVPACPTFIFFKPSFFFNSYRILFTTSKDVQSRGLLTNNTSPA